MERYTRLESLRYTRLEKDMVGEGVVVEERYAVRKENVAGENTWFNGGCRRDTRYDEKYIKHALKMRGF